MFRTHAAPEGILLPEEFKVEFTRLSAICTMAAREVKRQSLVFSFVGEVTRNYFVAKRLSPESFNLALRLGITINSKAY